MEKRNADGCDDDGAGADGGRCGSGRNTGAGGAAEMCDGGDHPVTGHVLCIEPLGAPVEAPPDAKLPCKPEDAPEDARGQWSYGPNCTPTPEG